MTEHQQTAPWRIRRRVLPQHTDHAGVMWHGAYVAWMEEARVEALAGAGIDYAALAARGLELPVVGLSIQYRQGLQHGDLVEIVSTLLPHQGAKLPWRTQFLKAGGTLAAESLVELVLIDQSRGPGRPRVLRRHPEDLADAIARLRQGPLDPDKA